MTIRESIKAVNDALKAKIESEKFVLPIPIPLPLMSDFMMALSELETANEIRIVSSAPTFPEQYTGLDYEEILTTFPTVEERIFALDVRRAEDGTVTIYRTDGSGLDDEEKSQFVSVANVILS